MKFDSAAYLTRVGLDGPIEATEEGFAALHQAQTLAIPFENFDIHLGRGISLDPDRLFGKLVNRARGGYCFELNSLFGMALDAFGFERRPLLAHVQFRGRLTSRAHLLNLVNIAGRDWIADVGFGFINLGRPIPLQRDRIQRHEGTEFRLVDGGRFGTMLEFREIEDWNQLFSFDMEHVWPIDIELGNHFTSTHPDALFTRARVAVRTLPNGKTTLMDYKIREHAAGGISETVLQPGPAYLESLQEKFGINLDSPYDALRPLPVPGG